MPVDQERRPTPEDWQAFSDHVSAVYEELGAEVYREGSIGGARFDMIVESDADSPLGTEARIVVEVHVYRRKAGIQTVAALAATVDALKAEEAIDGVHLVVSSGFTNAALALGKKLGFLLTTLGNLAKDARRWAASRNADLQQAQEVVSHHRIAVDTSEKETILVLMPYKSKYYDVFASGVLPAAEELGMIAYRIKDLEHNGEIIEIIRSQIAKARYVVGITSGANANVFYELGYADAMKKDPILATDNTAKIPFDLRGRNHIHYSSSLALKERLVNRIDSMRTGSLVSPTIRRS